MNFEELGLTLMRERERQGLSIETVMEATKISRRNIAAMESGDRDDLPHAVYTKGFIKSYARYLGLDADELSMIVDHEFTADDDVDSENRYDVAPVAEKAFSDTDACPPCNKTNWLTIVAIVFLIGVVVFLVMTIEDSDKPEPVQPPAVEEKAEPAPVVPDPVVTPSEEQPAVDVAPEQSQQPAEAVEPLAVEEPVTEAPAVAPAVSEAKKPEVVADKTAPAKVEEKKEEALAPKPTPEKQKYDHVLIIRATTDKGCWIGVWRGNDEKMARDFVLKQGEPLRLMFNNPRRIRIGNVAGVSVLYNGKPYKLDANKSNIQTLRFGQHN